MNFVNAVWMEPVCDLKVTEPALHTLLLQRGAVAEAPGGAARHEVMLDA